MSPNALPIRETPYPDESLTGLVRRYVVAMGYESFSRLLTLVDGERFPRHLENLRCGPTLTALAKLLRREPGQLVPLTIPREPVQFPRQRQPDHAAGGEVRFSGTAFDPSRRRVCAACLAEQPDREKLSWLFRPLEICPEHGVLLQDRCADCGRAFAANRLDLVRCRCGASVSSRTPERLSTAAIDIARTIRTWFEGRPLAPWNLAGSLLHQWSERLQVAVTRTSAWVARTRWELDLSANFRTESVAWLGAAELLRKWPAGITEFLDEFQESESSGLPSTRIGRAFSRLLRDAERLEQAGCNGPAETFREYLLERYTRGHLSGKGSLFRDARQRERIVERPWISQTEAARLLKLRPPAVAELVRRKILEGHVRISGRRGRTNGVVRREAVVAYGRRLVGAISVAEAAERLGTSSPRILDLIRAEVLKDAVRSSIGWRIPADVVVELTDRFRRLPINTKHNRLPLSEALRRFGVRGLSLAPLLRSLIDGELNAWREGESAKLRDLRFDPTELRNLTCERKLRTPAESGYTLLELGRSLFVGRSLRPIVLRKWIAAGLLNATRRRKSWHVAAEEVARFRATYCLAREVCSLLDVARSTLDVWQRRRRLVPVYSRSTHPGAGTPVYLRVDVDRLALARAA